MNKDELPFSPAAERNQGPILAALAGLLAPDASILEIASGTGQHAAHFAAARPGWRWWPSDAQAEALPSIAARCAGLANVAAPVRLDVTADPWPEWPTPFDAVYCANLLHIAPWPTCRALMAGAARSLRPRGLLVLYGPFVVDGEPTAPSNLAFDADLRRRNPQWGLRHLGEVLIEAVQAGLAPDRRLEMPANNLLLGLRRGGPGVVRSKSQQLHV